MRISKKVARGVRTFRRKVARGVRTFRRKSARGVRTFRRKSASLREEEREECRERKHVKEFGAYRAGALV